MIDKEKALEIFAKNLRMQRASKKISQEKLAEMSNITHQHFYRIENGKSSPTLGIIVNLAEALNVDMNTLLPMEELRKK